MIAPLSFKKASWAKAFHVRPILVQFLCLGKFFDMSIKRVAMKAYVSDIPRKIVCNPQEPPKLTNSVRVCPTLRRQHFPWCLENPKYKGAGEEFLVLGCHHVPHIPVRLSRPMYGHIAQRRVSRVSPAGQESTHRV